MEVIQEMIDFRRSEEALTAYSNYQELFALANMFNIKIDIFTYRNVDDGWWGEVTPDPDMISEAESKLGKLMPDMALYHSDQTHYDLLVKKWSIRNKEKRRCNLVMKNFLLNMFQVIFLRILRKK